MDLVTGNAARDGAPLRGWFVGHFVPDGLPKSEQVEIKWGVHAHNDTRSAWASSAAAMTLSVLVRGRFRLTFESGEHLLARSGDYALWGPGVVHRWQAEEDDTVVLTVRWPSVAGDAREH